MTNQQGAPEALPDPSPDKLRAIARTARNSSGSASDDCGPLAYVLHGWRAAVIAFRAQQAAMVEAQQPAPSAAAVVGTNTKTAELLSTTVGLLIGYREGGARQPYKPGSVVAKVIDEVVDHLKDWPYPEPSPTPQADSQPAPVLGEPTWTVFNSGAQVAEVESLAEAMEYLTPERLSRQWCAVCVVDQSNLPKARAPADSVTAPAGPGWQLVPTDPTNEMLDAARRACEGRMYPQDMRHGPRAMMADRYNAMLAAAPTPPAQAADSVLEDAARWQFAEANMTYAEFKDGSYFNTYMWPQAESKEAARAAIDAARKQGANHD